MLRRGTGMATENTVTIPLDEYFDLRQKAEMNAFLMNELGRMESRFIYLEKIVFDCENEVRMLRDGN